MLVTLTWLYGVLAIASIFITAGMCRMGYEHLRDRPNRARTKHDMFLMVVIYAGLHGLGGAIWWVLRSWDALVNEELNEGSAPIAVIAAAILYAVGKGGLVFASSLNGKPVVWRLFVIISVLWSIVVWWGLFF